MIESPMMKQRRTKRGGDERESVDMDNREWRRMEMRTSILLKKAEYK